jgi:hypothetical protein
MTEVFFFIRLYYQMPFASYSAKKRDLACEEDGTAAGDQAVDAKAPEIATSQDSNQQGERKITYDG